jgi:hypothetical protein
VIDLHCILSFGRKGGGSVGPPSEHFYICEAPGLNFWRFVKQIRKQIACKLTVFYKNGYHFSKIIIIIRQILHENVKILT